MDSTGAVTRDLVAVGVDGTDDALRALRYAVEAAQRTGGTLRLVHVQHEPAATAPLLPMFQAATLRVVGNGILDDAEAHVHEFAGHDLSIEKYLLEGPCAEALVTAAGHGTLVLGPRRSSPQHLMTSSTTTAVAAHAQGPVVCVPPGWEPGEHHARPLARRHGTVLVGIDGTPASRQVLEAAFTAADERGDGLSVLHAWRPRGWYDVTLGGPLLAESWERQTEPVIWEQVAALRGDHPGVDVSVVLRFERPELALADEAAKADLLVVGRVGDEHSSLALGSTARALIHACPCPVEVVPVPAAYRVPSQRVGTSRGAMPRPVSVERR